MQKVVEPVRNRALDVQLLRRLGGHHLGAMANRHNGTLLSTISNNGQPCSLPRPTSVSNHWC